MRTIWRAVYVLAGFFAVSACGTLTYADFVYLEDFESGQLHTLDDLLLQNPTHALTGTNFSLVDDTFSAAVPPSAHHQLFIGADTTDALGVFVLLTDWIDHVSLWMTGTGGGMASMEVTDTTGLLVRFETLAQDSYQFFDTVGSGLGFISSIRLNVPPALAGGPGMRGLYDDIAFYIVPEPSTLRLVAVGLAGLVAGVLMSRRARHCVAARTIPSTSARAGG